MSLQRTEIFDDLYNATTINNTSSSVPIFPVWVAYSQWLTAGFILTVLLCIVGFFLNLLLFAAIVTSPRLRQGSGALIAHSVMLEIILSAVIFPLITASYLPNIQPSPAFCRYAMLFYYGCMWAGNWANVLLAVNRFIAIFFPHHYKKTRTPLALLVFVFVGWMFAASAVLPLFFKVGAVFEVIVPWGACGARPTGLAYGIITTISTPVPIAGIGLIYVVIFTAEFVRKQLSKREVSPDSVTGRTRNLTSGILRKRLKTARMLFVSFIWYAICYLPAPIASSASPEDYASQPLVSLFLRLLLVCSTTTSPIIYLSMNAAYRRSARRVIVYALKGCRSTGSERKDLIGTGSGTKGLDNQGTSKLPFNSPHVCHKSQQPGTS